MAGQTGNRTRASGTGARSRAAAKSRSATTSRSTAPSARSNESGRSRQHQHPARDLLAAERTGPHAHLPVFGDVTLPPVEHVAWYAAIGLLTALELIEWPVALLVTAGKLLADNRHNATLQNVGDALENAG